MSGGEIAAKPRAGAHAPPAKAWRNWYYLGRAIFSKRHGKVMGPGEVAGAMLWPSKDAAETKASEEMAHNATLSSDVDYIGAFPADETPP
jgi:hypothetical protein